MMIFQASGNRNLVNHYMFFFFRILMFNCFRIVLCLIFFTSVCRNLVLTFEWKHVHLHGMLSKFDISPKMDGWKLEDYFPVGTRKLVTFQPNS